MIEGLAREAVQDTTHDTVECVRRAVGVATERAEDSVSDKELRSTLERIQGLEFLCFAYVPDYRMQSVMVYQAGREGFVWRRSN